MVSSLSSWVFKFFLASSDGLHLLDTYPELGSRESALYMWSHAVPRMSISGKPYSCLRFLKEDAVLGG